MGKAFSEITLESAEKKLESAVPDSPEYKQLEKTLAQQRTKVIQAGEAVSQTGLAPSAKKEEFLQDPKDSEPNITYVSPASSLPLGSAKNAPIIRSSKPSPLGDFRESFSHRG